MKKMSKWKKAAQRFRLSQEETVLLESVFDKDYLEQERIAGDLRTTVEELSKFIKDAVDRYGCRVPTEQATEWKAMWQSNRGTEKALYVLFAAISMANRYNLSDPPEE
jgi:hypothetical protein